MAKHEYEYGISKEKKIANLLRRKSASVKASPASRGVAGLRVTFSTGTKWNVQVKSSHTGKPAPTSARDLERFKQSSTKSSATAVIANITAKGIEYRSARDGRKLTPPPRKRRE